MKKNMIIYMSKLSVGGMEKALLNLIKNSNLKKNYNITIYLLYSMEDKYLKELEEQVNIKLLWKKEWNLLGKLVCIVKILIDMIKLKIFKNSYDVAICYPYQHSILALLTLNSSENNIIFLHNNIEKKYGDNVSKYIKKMHFNKFKKIIAVSNDAIEVFKKLVPDYRGETAVIHNYIDGKDILIKSVESIEETNLFSEKDGPIFINIARHEEKSKKISRIINSSKRLLDEGYKFKVILIGDGEDHKKYSEMIHNFNIDKNVILLGKKINPYPYLKSSDCFLLSSSYEGYGIVLDEARILDVPIISTDVADAKLILEDGYGILCKNSSDGVYDGMKEYLDNGFSLAKRFDYNKFNQEITKLLDEFVK